MITLRSFVAGSFVAGQGPLAPLCNPATEEPIAQTGTAGIDMGATLDYARQIGGPALRKMNFQERGHFLLAASKALHARRDELIALALESSGNTRGDAKFDIDGAIGTLAAYAEVGQGLGPNFYLRDGEGVQPTRSAKLWGQHLWLPRTGVAVHINAFNFPAWGTCEKAAVAWLCGQPVLSKPATSTAAVAARVVEILIESGHIPQGALSFLCGGVGDLLDRLGDQDTLAFTGSSDTAHLLRRHAATVERGVRLNVEADSLNAAVLGPDGDSGSEGYDLFLGDITRDITQKTGQKCTAMRRILVPRDRIDDVAADLVDRLGQVRTGNPVDDSVTMGPLATAAQLGAVRHGIAHLAADAGTTVLCGGAGAIQGLGAPADKGYFVAPTLLRCDQPATATAIHRHEVFGPVATIMPYENAKDAVALVRRGGGGLVASIYSDDRAFVPEVALGIGASTGRVFVGGAKLGGQSPGPGTVLPQLNHGGPGHAGDGHELGGVRGMHFYMQRCALAGYKPTIEALLPRPA